MRHAKQQDSQQSGEQINDYQQYFVAKSKAKPKDLYSTSKDYYYSHSQFIDHLKSIKDPEPFEIDEELKKQIMIMIETGENICFYGKGSKYSFIQNLVEQIERPFKFTVKGFSSSINEKTIINQFGDNLHLQGILKSKERMDLQKQIERYKEALKQTSDSNQILITIHNLDGQNLLEYEAQHLISQLAQLPKVQMICSIDSVKIPMHWSPETLTNFKFLFYHVATKIPYKIQFACLLKANQKKEKLEQALKFIMKSLNKNQKEILKVLARRALKNMAENQNEIYSFSQLLDQCIKQTILNTDYQLRQNLIQLLDHKVIEETTQQNKKKGYSMMHHEKKYLEFVISDIQE